MRRKYSIALLSALFILLFAACTGRLALHKIDFRRYGDMPLLSEVLKDTLLPDGTCIEYRVLKRTRDRDLYLLWGKGQQRDTLLLHDLMDIADLDYFPVYVYTKNGYHWFDKDCAAIECAASLLLSDRGDGYSAQLTGVLEEFPEQEALIYSESMYSGEIDRFYYFDVAQRSRDTFYLPRPGYFYQAVRNGDSLLTEFSTEAYGEGDIRLYTFSVAGK